MKNPFHIYSNKLEKLKQADQLRELKRVDARTDKTILYKGRPCLNLTSNDYLGLATDTELCRRFYDAVGHSGVKGLINTYGLGSSSSRLLTGNSTLYENLEKQICQWYGGKQSALIFNSGYHANLGIIPALAGEKDLILSDSLNHASIIDGIRLSRAACEVFPHNDLETLEQLLEEKRDSYENAVIITESLFSMDGDRADIKGLVNLKNKYGTLLYIDEAHSVGVYGSQGQGLCHEAGLHGDVDILLGTMGKALASHGAYIVTSPTLKAYLINCARSLIFSTALPPVAVSWNLFILGQMADLDLRRKHLTDVSDKFRRALTSCGLDVIGDSQIIPVITKGNRQTVKVSDALIQNGFLAFPIRPPSVPGNNSRIRFSLTPDILFKDLEPIPELINESLKNIE